jgi:hypothetical protein
LLERGITKARVFLPLGFWSGINSYQWNEMVRFGTVFRFFEPPQRHREHRDFDRIDRIYRIEKSPI